MESELLPCDFECGLKTLKDHSSCEKPLGDEFVSNDVTFGQPGSCENKGNVHV